MSKVGRIASWAVAVVLTGVLFSPEAKATYILDVNQVGSNVVFTGSGTIDTKDLTLEFTQGIVPEIHSQISVITVGTAASGNVYDGSGDITGPASFGTGPVSVAPDTASGDITGIGAGGVQLAVPAGYVSGSALSGGMVIDFATYSNLGIAPGTFTWSWGSGDDADSFILNIHEPTVSTDVPEPPTLAILMAGLLGLGFLSRRQAKRDAR